MPAHVSTLPFLAFLFRRNVWTKTSNPWVYCGPVWRSAEPVGRDYRPCRWPDAAEGCIAARQGGQRWLGGHRCCWDIATWARGRDDIARTTGRLCHESVAMSTTPAASPVAAASHRPAAVNVYERTNKLEWHSVKGMPPPTPLMSQKLSLLNERLVTQCHSLSCRAEYGIAHN